MTSDGHVFVIAEAGSNWRSGTPARDMRMAKTLIDVAVDAGADAVKFQTYRAETVYVAQAGMVKYLEESGVYSDIIEIFNDLSMPYEMIAPLHEYCEKQGIEFMSSAFGIKDFEAVNPYVKRHKIASYEISHLRLLEIAARTGKPIILSVGASVEEDIDWAIRTLKANNSGPITLMQCTLAYPAPPESLNLRVIPWLKQCFNLPVGFSDHSRDPLCGPLAAVALGATVIEKHYTIDNRLPGPDHFFALTPSELKKMVQAIRDTEKMLGDGRKTVEPAEQEMYRFGRRGVQAIQDIARDGIFQEGVNIDILRPGHQSSGVHPRLLPEILGKRATKDISAGSGIHLGDWTDA
ncbi:MAG: N-acetylneuraminate synthase family protein [Chlamydiales bacterium]|nr:N-acetylneuraminate synthase family protein [Chlamydiales bacterium]